MIYIDNAATSRKKPFSVIFSQLKYTAFSANAGRGGHKAGIKTAMKIEEAREIIRKCFFDGDVIFTKNCTEALNLAIVGSNPCGKVITTVFDHNSVLRTLKRAELSGKVRLSVISPDENGFELPLKRALTKDTSLVVVTARSNVNGVSTHPEVLARVVKEMSDARFILDAAQSAGHDLTDCSDIDMIASSGHKGLKGPQGTGFLLMKRGIRLTPIITGGTGTSSNTLEIPLEVPEGFEAGTLNSAGIIALGKGTKYAFENRERISNRITSAAKCFESQIKKLEGVTVYPSEGGIVLCNVGKEDSTLIADELSQRFGICVRGGLHCAPLMHNWLGTGARGAVRFSFGDNNSRLQAYYAAYAIKKLAQKHK